MMSIKAIDCDVHPTVVDIRQLVPHLDEYWRDSVEERGIGSLESSAYPPNAPITARPDWRGENGYAATTAAELASQVLDKWDASHAICNCLYGVQLVYNEDMAQRSISSTAYSTFCIGTMIEARRRGSRSSHSLAIQSFSARWKARAMSSL